MGVALRAMAKHEAQIGSEARRELAHERVGLRTGMAVELRVFHHRDQRRCRPERMIVSQNSPSQFQHFEVRTHHQPTVRDRLTPPKISGPTLISQSVWESSTNPSAMATRCARQSAE